MDAYYNRLEEDHSGLKHFESKGNVESCSVDSSSVYDSSDDSDQSLSSFNDRFESSDGLEIHVNSNIDRGAVARNGDSKTTFGPTGNTRKMVIKALHLLSGKIHKSNFARNVETRSKARVPIICVNTCLGFDGDIALGGHNGTDTSHYVRKQVERYER